MHRKLLALLTAALLFLTGLPALAEEAGAAAVASGDVVIPAPFEPVPEDFHGTWTPLYAVADGAISPVDAAITGVTICSDGTMTDLTGNGSHPCTIDGDTLTAAGGAALQLVAPGLMVARNGGVSLVLQRTAVPANPFLGDWLPVSGAFGGEVVTRIEESQGHMRFEDGAIVIVNAAGGMSVPCVYTGGVCRIDAGGVEGVASIDEAGLMTFSFPETGLVYLLIRIR